MATTKAAEPSPDVPLFLRKTWHMINTADPKIAGWSEEGDTFVIKDPQKFQEICIPAYFKHTKFSSFVRQLNFYSFRKIKHTDHIIRIDEKLEAETANHWRFRHENFRRGHPELLVKVKRMQAGAKAAPKRAPEIESSSKEKPTSTTSTTTPSPEVQSLKQRIEEMSKNIDQLTAMVQKVSLKQEEQEKQPAPAAAAAPEPVVGSKRKKLDTTTSDATISKEEVVRPDAMISSSMDVDEQREEEKESLSSSPPSLPPPLPSVLPMPLSPISYRETSDTTHLSDTEFVNQLFSEFNDPSIGLLPMEESSLPEPQITKLASSDSTSSLSSLSNNKNSNNNRPDPELMERLGDALALLPKDIQVLIVDRLIAAITSTEGFESTRALAAAAASVDDVVVEEEEEPKKVAAQDVATPTEGDKEKAFPLAAATLAALLHHYSSSQRKTNPKSVQKTIPVIPVHA